MDESYTSCLQSKSQRGDRLGRYCQRYCVPYLCSHTASSVKTPAFTRTVYLVLRTQGDTSFPCTSRSISVFTFSIIPKLPFIFAPFSSIPMLFVLNRLLAFTDKVGDEYTPRPTCSSGPPCNVFTARHAGFFLVYPLERGCVIRGMKWIASYSV